MEPLCECGWWSEDIRYDLEYHNSHHVCEPIVMTNQLRFEIGTTHNFGKSISKAEKIVRERVEFSFD